MASKLSRTAYDSLVQQDRDWLMKQPRTLERDHIALILDRSAEHEYADAPALRDMAKAPRDGTPVLLKFRDDLTGTHQLEDVKGLSAVMRHTGRYLEWCFAAPVGMGGFKDEHFAGWLPLPRAAAATGDG